MTMRQISPGQERWALLIMAFLFALAAPFLPVLGVVFLLGWTAPLVVLIVRHGYGYAVPGVVLAAGFYYAVLGALGALHTLFLVVPLAFFLGFGLRRKWEAVRLIKWGLVISLLGTLVSLLFAALIFGVDPLAPFIEAVRESYQGLGSAMQSSGSLTPTETQALEKQVASLVETVSLIAPTIFVVESALAVLVNFVAAGVLARRCRPCRRFASGAFPSTSSSSSAFPSWGFTGAARATSRFFTKHRSMATSLRRSQVSSRAFRSCGMWPTTGRSDASGAGRSSPSLF